MGSPVLLLHGGFIDHASLSYRYCIGPISRTHRVFAPDLPGFGKSDKPRIQYTTEYYIGFLGHLMDALGLARTHLAGVSQGGAVALGFSLQSPERVDRLVLAGTYGLGNKVPYGLLAYLVVRLPFFDRRLLLTVGQSRLVIRLLARLVTYDPRTLTGELIDEIRESLREPGVGEAWRSWQKREIRWRRLRTDYVGRLPELRVPTLFLDGARSRLGPVRWAERAYALTPDSTLQIVPDAGHWLPRERPDLYNRAVLDFLGG